MCSMWLSHTGIILKEKLHSDSLFDMYSCQWVLLRQKNKSSQKLSGNYDLKIFVFPLRTTDGTCTELSWLVLQYHLCSVPSAAQAGGRLRGQSYFLCFFKCFKLYIYIYIYIYILLLHSVPNWERLCFITHCCRMETGLSCSKDLDR